MSNLNRRYGNQEGEAVGEQLHCSPARSTVFAFSLLSIPPPPQTAPKTTTMGTQLPMTAFFFPPLLQLKEHAAKKKAVVKKKNPTITNISSQ